MRTESVLNLARGTKRRRFIRHLFEMTFVMMLGMIVLGAAFRQLHILVCGDGFAAAWDDQSCSRPRRWRST
jgi:hypothetical protein